MALQDILGLKATNTISLMSSLVEEQNTIEKVEITSARLEDNMPYLRRYISYWREYPDVFVEFLCGEDNPSNFKLFFYQRVFLRACMRHRYMYATFPRAYSKSFLAVLVLMIRCVLYPGSRLFVTSGGKDFNRSCLNPFNCWKTLRGNQQRGRMTFAPFNDYLKRVHSSEWKQGAPVKGDDIVSSLLKNRAVEKTSGEVACFTEDIASSHYRASEVSRAYAAHTGLQS